MLDRLAGALFDASSVDPADVLHSAVTQHFELDEERARLRLALPLARKSDINVKKIGQELVVRVDGHKRTIALPSALASYRPSGAEFSDGALEVSFDAVRN